MSEARTGGAEDWARIGAEFRAVSGFYRALGEQARRATRGEALPPIVPPNEELTFVNGFVVWQGHPVWWSGEAAGSPGPESREPGIVNPRVTTQPPSFRRRRGISRFLHALGLI